MTPIIHVGQSLRVKARFQNLSPIPTPLRVLPLMVGARIYSGEKRIPTKIGAGLEEIPYSEIEVLPGDVVERQEDLELTVWYTLAPGRYRIRFYYDLSLLLPDRAKKEEYAKRYHAEDDFVAWGDGTHGFEVIK